MPQIQSSKRERTSIPAGDHILTLVEVKQHDGENAFFDKTKEVGGANQPRRTRLIWQFTSEATDNEGVHFEHAIWTGEFYGNPRAGLTALLDQMLPEADENVRENVNTDTLIGTRYQAKIRLVRNQKGDVVPKAVDLEPIKGEGQTATPFDPDDVPNDYPAKPTTQETPF